MKRRIGLYSGILFLFLLGVAVWQFSRPAMPPVSTYPCKDCNVILICLDTLGANHLSFEGYPKPTSPNLDRFSKKCAAFTHAFSPDNFTLPSDFSIFTSLYPSSHHITTAFQDSSLSAEAMTLPEILKLYKYWNVWMATLDDPLLPIKRGLGRGFDEFNEFGGGETWSNVLGWFGRHAHDKKFFVFIHTYAAHSPYVVKNTGDIKPFFHRHYRGNIPTTPAELTQFFVETLPRLYQVSPRLVTEMFGNNVLAQYPELLEGKLTPRAIQLIENPQWRLDFMQKYMLRVVSIHLYWDTVNMDDADDLSYLRALYDARIREADSQVGKLLDLLKKKELLKKTIVVITSEHGESLFEHGINDHGKSLFNPEIQVPLLIYVPGVKGQVITNIVGTIDIMPTILEALGIPIPAQAQGISLLPQIKESPNAPTQTYLFSENQNAFYGKEAVISQNWKLVETGEDLHQFLLFDLEHDPGETRSIATSHPKVMSRLLGELRIWERQQWRQKANPPWEKIPYLDEAAKDRLRKSGYW